MVSERLVICPYKIGYHIDTNLICYKNIIKDTLCWIIQSEITLYQSTSIIDYCFQDNNIFWSVIRLFFSFIKTFSIKINNIHQDKTEFWNKKKKNWQTITVFCVIDQLAFCQNGVTNEYVNKPISNLYCIIYILIWAPCVISWAAFCCLNFLRQQSPLGVIVLKYTSGSYLAYASIRYSWLVLRPTFNIKPIQAAIRHIVTKRDWDISSMNHETKTDWDSSYTHWTQKLSPLLFSPLDPIINWNSTSDICIYLLPKDSQKSQQLKKFKILIGHQWHKKLMQG